MGDKEKVDLWEKEKRELLERMIEKVTSISFLGSSQLQQVQEQKLNVS